MLRPADESIIVVTGLPRSGTSLLMQMLHAGGVAVLTDSCRPPDINNPRGYFEYEKVKWLAADNSWLVQARGKAVKVIAQLAPFLPRALPYRVLFIERDINEVIRSQAKMIERLGGPATGDSVVLAAIFERHLAAAREFFNRQPQTISETFQHRELLTEPSAAIDRLAKFLDDWRLDRQAMLGTIDASLYRMRSSEFGH